MLSAQVTQPASDKPEDVEAARAAIFAVGDRSEWNNAWWTDPVLLGQVPRGRRRGCSARTCRSSSRRDLDEMKQPLDFLGLNIYKADTYRRGADGKPEQVPLPPGYPRAGVGLAADHARLHVLGAALLLRPLQAADGHHRERPATRDQVFLDGKVHDPQRIDFMHRYLAELARAIKDGVPVTGYYAWSLLDNFEWADGYKQRFGLVYVDYQNQKRVPKDSFDWYKKVIATQRPHAGRQDGRCRSRQVTPRP